MVSKRRGKVSSMKEEDILNLFTFSWIFEPVRLLCVLRVITLQINSMALLFISLLPFSATKYQQWTFRLSLKMFRVNYAPLYIKENVSNKSTIDRNRGQLLAHEFLFPMRTV